VAVISSITRPKSGGYGTPHSEKWGVRVSYAYGSLQGLLVDAIVFKMFQSSKYLQAVYHVAYRFVSLFIVSTDRFVAVVVTCVAVPQSTTVTATGSSGTSHCCLIN